MSMVDYTFGLSSSTFPLFMPFATQLCSSSHWRNRNISIPCFWVFPCALPWPTKWNRSGKVPASSSDFKKNLMCFCFSSCFSYLWKMLLFYSSASSWAQTTRYEVDLRLDFNSEMNSARCRSRAIQVNPA